MKRKFNGEIALFLTGFAIIISLIHIWYNSFGLIDVVKKNSFHITLLMGLGFLYYPATAKSPQEKPSWMDWILFSLSIVVCIYFALAYDRLAASVFQPTFTDYVYGVLFMILTVEASRRFVGLPITILSVFFLFYAYFGPYFPGVFAHKGFTVQRIIIRMTMTDEGILGIALMVSSSYIFMFILFSSFLKVTKAAGFFNDIAFAIAGTTRGGPAKIAIVASCLTGTISGSSQANVVTTGTFTIPLMKSIGYKPHFAAAVEAVASTGGTYMPPIMGAAAFIMSSFLGISYTTIMLAGFVPALLYYYNIFVMVDLRAKELGLLGLPRERLPKLRKVLLDGGHLLIPLVLIIISLLVGYSPLSAAFTGIISVVIVAALRKHTRLALKDFIEALQEGAVGAIEIAVICGIVGFIIGSVTMTGIGNVIGQYVVSISGENLAITLIFCMITAFILGMGLPGPACYIVTVTIVAPSIILLGINNMAAHFFVFYFGMLSGVIPPVALTSYTAAAIAKAAPTKVALTGFGLASAGIILPYSFIYNPEILLINFEMMKFLYTIVAMLMALFCSAVAIIGLLKVKLLFMERVIFAVATILLISPETRIAGFVVAAGILFLHIFMRSRATGK
jgi:TRAP transporter 4TM/12TM fusion protein